MGYSILCGSDSNAVKIDSKGNYTTKDCWSFEKPYGYVYTQWCAHWVIDATPVYDLDELIWEYVKDTTIFTFAVVFAQFIDVIMLDVSMWFNMYRHNRVGRNYFFINYAVIFYIVKILFPL